MSSWQLKMWAWEQLLATDLDLEIFDVEGVDEGINTDEILGGNYAEKVANSRRIRTEGKEKLSESIATKIHYGVG